MSRTTESGRIGCAAGEIWYDDGPRGSWRLPVSDLALLGEYTTARGPFVDDYFFVFAHRDGTLLEASFYAADRDRALADLGTVLGVRLQPGLCNSTEWKSRILWPPGLAGSSLFELRPVEEPGAWARLREALWGARQEVVVSPEVERFLAEAHPR